VRKKITLLAIISTLPACSTVEDSDLQKLRSAESGVRVTVELMKEGSENPAQPAVTAGLLAGAMLGKPISDFDDPSQPIPTDSDAGEDTELIHALVKLLGMDIQEVLNNAQDRGDGLDAYANALESSAQRGHIRLRALQDAVEENEDDSSRFERRVRELRDEIEDAITDGNTSRVTLLTDELIQKQTMLAKADSDLIVGEYLVQAYEDVLEPIGNRLKAIRANRDALMKGVKIIDMPGVEDLKIIEYEDGAIRVRAGGRSFF